jgi:DNA-directed RNA polymerase specialized sigma24 family protein
MRESPSGVQLLGKLSEDLSGAASEVVRRYRPRLIRLVESRLDCRLRRRFDPEEVVQSALASFFRRMDDGQYCIRETQKLWKLLATISMHKMLKRIERERATCRTFEREDYCAQADFGTGMKDQADMLPEAALIVADLIENCLHGLAPSYGAVLYQRLAGASITEIADHVGHTRSTVRCMLRRIGKRLEALLREVPSD